MLEHPFQSTHLAVFRFDVDGVEVIGVADVPELPGFEIVEDVQELDRSIAVLQAEKFAKLVELVDVYAERCASTAADSAVVGSGSAAVDGSGSDAAGGSAAVVSGVAFRRAAAELEAGLRLTAGQAESVLGLACTLVRQQPRVLAAMRAGVVDEARARVFCKELAVVSDDSVREMVLDRVLPVASELTSGQLRYRIQMLVRAVEPEQASRQYAEAVEARDVYFEAASDGTVVVAGERLPVGRAVAARERINALAKAAKTGGDARSMGLLRADVFLGLLNGDYSGPDAPQRRGVVELTVPLTTLIGLSQAPGELGGWAPVVADVARQVGEDQRDDATWRYTVTDEHGGVIHHGITGQRPTTASGRSITRRRRMTRRRPAASAGRGTASTGSQPPTTSTVGQSPTATGSQPPTTSTVGQPPTATGSQRSTAGTGRRPTAGDAAFVRARDRRCRFPTCRVPAAGGDIDHRIRHTDGGPSTVDNLQLLCRRHHRLKDEYGWKVRYLGRGRYLWISPLGHRYVTRRERLDHPEPPAQPQPP
jgi:Domain of unknown function (DUF222)/HNH endonuclease